MALKRRGQIWWIVFTTPDGKRVRRSTQTQDQKEAQRLHDTLKAEYWRVQALGEKPRRLWQDAVVRWAKDSKCKADYERDISKLKWLDNYLKDVYLDQITYDMLDRIAHAKEAEGSNNSTINRYLAVISAILRKAYGKWQWIDKIPSIPRRKEPPGRLRWLTRPEVSKLLNALPKHYALAARFTLATGPRQSNVLRMKWNQIDLDRKVAWLNPDETKNRQGVFIPLNDDAIDVLRECEGKHPDYVFTNKRGKPFFEIDNKLWKAALCKAGIEDFHWHDLRHTWASWHIQAGTSLAEIKAMGGWKTYQMVLRYAHLGGDQLHEAAKRIVVCEDVPKDGVSGQIRPIRQPPQLRLVK